MFKFHTKKPTREGRLFFVFFGLRISYLEPYFATLQVPALQYLQSVSE